MEDIEQQEYISNETDTNATSVCISSYSVYKINTMRNIIEKMNKFNQIEVLRILKDNNATLNENNYGIFVNLTNLNDSVLDKLTNYIEYVEDQEQNLNHIEKQKEDYINTYFTKDIKDITGNSISIS
jgi:septum formation inhibitor-activating ATPase MinD